MKYLANNPVEKKLLKLRNDRTRTKLAPSSTKTPPKTSEQTKNETTRASGRKQTADVDKRGASKGGHNDRHASHCSPPLLETVLSHGENYLLKNKTRYVDRVAEFVMIRIWRKEVSWLSWASSLAEDIRWRTGATGDRKQTWCWRHWREFSKFQTRANPEVKN